ncbi:MAG TPA: 4'-phosphopantetheinyl transferase superfamily protein [Candidatus Acidoferrales bacterium]|jgi:4'-phosphopantetheinyl transferase|nr:4'-phosphopantetheinyl transferase superfamily protein [Candidatus Acidoferrales bacterium]
MTSDIPFQPPPENLKPANGEVHVFYAPLNQPQERLEQFSKTLSEDENQRARRFHFGKDKSRFIAGRGMLRKILGWLLKVKPVDLAFSYGAHGKPRLALPTAENFLHFNVAHSDSVAVYAFSPVHEVGIDIERIRPLREVEDMVAHFFSETERTQWRSLPAAAKTTAFFNCWVRKEALLKARGKGIGEPLNSIEVLFGGNFFSAAPFSLHSLLPALDHVAAVAVKCRDPLIHCWCSDNF